MIVHLYMRLWALEAWVLRQELRLSEMEVYQL